MMSATPMVSWFKLAIPLVALLLIAGAFLFDWRAGLALLIAIVGAGAWIVFNVEQTGPTPQAVTATTPTPGRKFTTEPNATTEPTETTPDDKPESEETQ